MITKRTKIIGGIVALAAVLAVVGVVWQRRLLISATADGGFYNTREAGKAPLAAGFGPSRKLAFGLGRAAVSSVAEADQEAAGAPAPPEPGRGGATEREERLIIKTGTFSLVVKDVRQAVEAIIQYAQQQGGFVVRSSVSKVEKSGVAPSGSVTVRIPAAQFDRGAGAIRALGEVASEETRGQDVTEEFVDLESRLRNLRAAETALLSIMQRAGKIPDVLAVAQELNQVRGEIEQIQGRMKYLRQSAEFATLTVYLATDPEALPVIKKETKWKPWAVVKDSARELLGFGKRLVEIAIQLVIVVVPVVLVLGLIVWVLLFRLGRRLYRRWRG
ncbi:MAG: DUF4349 domain-containing protein [Candidatus Magasanikbacteria bacterium]|nr:DUF4349 domain-containing protein [Candidatus Magasanikbacteria bacterium]